MTTKNLPKLPSLPKSKTINRCECGCGGTTTNRFVPGHDSRLKGMKIRVERGLWNREQPEDTDAQLEALALAMSLGEAKATARALGIEDWQSAAEIADEAKTA